MKRILALVVCGACLSTASAATLYRWVSPNGVVTYQNTPPPRSARKLQVMHLGHKSSPSEVRKALSALHPVVLYAAPHCPPCRQVRAYLGRRKVPYKTIDVAGNQAALRAMKEHTGATTVPTITVGKHVLVGYIPKLLAEELTAAGYPAH